MEKYHIYEEIGKGEFSQVFKGREKKQIEYVAIKRVDKTMMNKVTHDLSYYDHYNYDLANFARVLMQKRL